MKFRKNLIYITTLLLLINCSEQKYEKTAQSSSNRNNNKVLENEWYAQARDKDFKPDVDLSKKNYYIILDASGSMLGNKIEVAKKALRKFITLIPASDNIGLMAFDKSGNFERATIGADRDLIFSKIEQVNAGGGTPLGKSVQIAYLKLAEKAGKQLGYGEYNLVIITDGKASDERKLNKIVSALLVKTPIVVHTIGFKIGPGHILNQPGKIYYKTANNFKELSQGLEDVLAESENFKETEY